tara:strand:- start:198 stop:1025 length:828 start_codon:yes stop_codon:yes gene_type:complete
MHLVPLNGNEIEFGVQEDVPYRSDLSDGSYAAERCVLDVYRPISPGDNPILIWFHGGGLEGGSKSSGLTRQLAESFASWGVTVVVPNYRLSPKVTFPTYLEDAAAAVRYTQENIAGNNQSIFIGGHSAGGYIAFMLALDRQFLDGADVDRENIAGYIPMSGQIMTHFTVAKERGIELPEIIADGAAPINHIGNETAPILVIIGGEDWPARLESNRYFVAAMRKVAKNENVAIIEVPDRTHGSILKGISNADDPAAIAAMSFLQSQDLPPDQLIDE